MKQHVSDGNALPYEVEHVQSIKCCGRSLSKHIEDLNFFQLFTYVYVHIYIYMVIELIAPSALKLFQKLIISVLYILFMLRIARLLLNVLNGCGHLPTRLL